MTQYFDYYIFILTVFFNYLNLLVASDNCCTISIVLVYSTENRALVITWIVWLLQTCRSLAWREYGCTRNETTLGLNEHLVSFSSQVFLISIERTCNKLLEDYRTLRANCTNRDKISSCSWLHWDSEKSERFSNYFRNNTLLTVVHSCHSLIITIQIIWWIHITSFIIIIVIFELFIGSFCKTVGQTVFLSLVSELVRRFRNPPLRLIKRSTASLHHLIIIEGGTSETYFKF